MKSKSGRELISLHSKDGIMSEQANLFFLSNQNLFSSNYLEHRLPETDLWKVQKAKAVTAFERIRSAYESIRPLRLGPGEEAELEDKFIKPVLSSLGFFYHVQVPASRGTRKKVPDYALFRDHESYKSARKVKDSPAKFFSHSLTVLEAKYWGRRLNDTDKKDILDSRDPTAQTVKYLDSVNYHTGGKINWAILTSGKIWRLFYFRASSRSGNYFEIDLEEMITRGDIEAFLYFFLFFSKDAFLPDPVTGKTWLDQHLKGTEDYAARVSTKLKDRIFDQVFEGLAAGFIEYRRGELGISQETDESLKAIFNGCLTLLYRMLFLLYAESRGLLPVNDPDRYYRKSLKKIKEDICDELKRSGIEGMSRNAYDYWSRLESLFRIIDKGDNALNIPIYNGGLFEAIPDGFLAKHKISDPFIAEAVKLLTVDPDAGHTPGATPFFDYSSLNVRHLGDIYEGLLEFHVRIAETEMVEVREKGKSLWKKKAEVKPATKTGRPKEAGEVYIENSKHERKATGSYYTPHYIVEYIVANTVGPVLNERLGMVKTLLADLETLYVKQRRQLKKPADWKHWEHSGEPKGRHGNEIVSGEDEVFETLFDIKVLDPAMGSGHFLVHAVDFISDKIITFLSEYPDNPIVRWIDELRNDILGNIREQKVTIDEGKLTDVNLIKRMVMKRCIYGVDLNEMAVELAKLSLWLDSFTLGAPLSFLDHHLKCGNSLIGTNIDELEQALSGHLFAVNLEPLKRAIRDMIFVKDYLKPNYEVFNNTADLYTYFFERGIKVLRIGGFFGMITSNKFMKTNYGLPLRKYLSENFIREIIDFGELPVFEEAATFPAIFIVERAEELPASFPVCYAPIRTLSFESLGAEIQRAAQTIDSNSLRGDSWSLVGSRAASVFAKMENIGIQLGEYCDGKIKYGVKTGLNEAFIIDGETRDEIIGDDYASEQFIKPLIVGDDVRKYEIDYKDAFLIVIPSAWTRISILDEVMDALGCPACDRQHLDVLQKCIEDERKWEKKCTEFGLDCCKGKKWKQILDDFRSKVDNAYEWFSENYPTIARHLGKYESAARRRTDQGDFWWELRPCDYYKYFETPKIVYPEIAMESRFAFDDTGAYPIKTIFTIPLDDKFLLAVLNSRITFEYLKNVCSVLGDVDKRGRLLMQLIYLEKLPVPRISFTTPEKERRERIGEAIELYEIYMVDLEQKGNAYEKAEAASALTRTVGRPVAGRKEGKVSGEYPGAGPRIHGVRGRTRKHDDAEEVHEESEEYDPASRSTRYIESSLGIKSYSELAPYLAKEVERVMVSLLEKTPDELKIPPEFICRLHKDAFEGLFPSWAGRYRDRNVKVGDYEPPPYFEVPILMRSYCDDLEFRLSSIQAVNPVPDALIEALAFAEGRLLSIHPFRDFNGRITRMLLFALLRRFDLPPVPLVPDEEDKTETQAYLNALSEADRMNWQPLIMIWRKRFGMEDTE